VDGRSLLDIQVLVLNLRGCSSTREVDFNKQCLGTCGLSFPYCTICQLPIRPCNSWLFPDAVRYVVECLSSAQHSCDLGR
jgi:hypothetical protein